MEDEDYYSKLSQTEPGFTALSTLLTIYSDELANQCVKSHGRNSKDISTLLEKIWKVIYKKIKKSNNDTIIHYGETFYLSLLLQHYMADRRDIPILQHIYEKLGDLSRYKAQASKDLQETFYKSAVSFYLKAYDLNRDQGLYFAKIALLQESKLAQLYFYCKSLGSVDGSKLAEDNLPLLYRKTSQTSNGFETDVEKLERMMVVFHQDLSIDSTSATLLTQCVSITELTDTLNPLNITDIIYQITVIILTTYHCFTLKFNEEQTTVPQKQKIRNNQVIMITFLFNVFSVIAPCLSSPDATVKLRWTASLIPQYFATHYDVFNVYSVYGKSNDKDRERFLIKRLESFGKCLSDFCNVLLEDEEIDEIGLRDSLDGFGAMDATAKEFHVALLGLSFYKAIASTDSNFSTRFLDLAQLMAGDEKIEFFHYDEDAERFSVVDKRLQMKKLAIRRLETEISTLQSRLPPLKKFILIVDPDCLLFHLDQVASWADALSNGNSSKGRGKGAKTNKNKKKHVKVVVSIDVLKYLDKEKKGNEKMNIRAREATRFLLDEVRSWSNQAQRENSNIVLQSPSEKLVIWDSNGVLLMHPVPAKPAIKNDPISVDSGFSEVGGPSTLQEPESEEEPNNQEHVEIPKHFREILSCALHFQAESLKSQEVTGFGAKVVLITNLERLTQFSLMVGIPTATVKEWNTIMRGG
ncbi:hypothetical protein HK098_005433 [Nowakowskiella sp. JEL0407]|nr:hypothetical protein HK098_005433 [Nowakowskiella sp. JEL0407]